MLMKRKQIIVDNITYEVVATVHDDNTNKDYVVYMDKNVDKNKELKLSCVLYYEENGEFIPVRITEEEDKETAKEIVMDVMKDLKNLL